MNRTRLHGSIVALVTPMAPDGAMDFEALDRLVKFHLDRGTDAIVVASTTGESATLGPEESIAVVRRVVATVSGRVPVIAGTGTNCTAETIRETQRAKQAGANACLLVTPYFNKPTQEGLYRHFAAVADAVEIPQILYNVPSRTQVDLLPETVACLAKFQNIIGIKEATGDLQRARDIMALCGSDFALYSGDDATACDACLLGAKGVISVTANVAPDLMRRMCCAAIAGDQGTAKACDAQLAALHHHLFIQSNPIPVKWALCEMGLIQPGIRLPLTWLPVDCRQKVRDAMQAAGVKAGSPSKRSDIS